MEKEDRPLAPPARSSLPVMGSRGNMVPSFWLALRGQWELMLGVCLALVVFAVYYGTLCPCVFPGDSAFACVTVLQAWPGHDFVGHPIANILARCFSSLPLGDLVFRLNVFSALCGAGAVFYLFKLVTLLLYDAMSEEQLIVPQNEDLPGEDRIVEETPHARDAIDEINDSAHRMAMAGGVISAIVFAFSTPFWLAATRFHYQTFETLLIIAVCYALVHYWVVASMRALAIAAILVGVGLIESTFFMVILPFALFCFVFAGYRHGHISTSFIALLVLYMAIGLSIAGAAQVMWVISTGGDFSVRAVMKVTQLWGQNQLNGVLAILSRKGWLILLAEGVIPLLLAYAARYPIAYTYFLSPQSRSAVVHERAEWREDQEVLSGLSWVIAVFVLLGCVAHAVLNLPGSPWHLSRTSMYLPILSFLGIAMTSGFLFTYGLLFGYQHVARRTATAAKSWASRVFSVGALMRAAIVGVLLVVIATSLVRNRRDVDGEKSIFVDVMCREVLNAAPHARCFVTDGAFDMNLLVQAWMQKRAISLINTQDLHQRASAGEATSAKGKTATAFLVEWLSKNPGAHAQVAMLDAPRLWFDAGLQAVPATLVYLGAKPGERLDVQKMLKQQRLFWEKNKPFLVGSDPRLMNLRRLQAQFRMQISRVANDLGVFCLHQKAESDAHTAFDFALEIDANNLPAWVNHAAIQIAHSPTNAVASVEQCVERVVAVMNKMPSGTSLKDAERHYGSLYLPAVEHLASLCIGRTSLNASPKASALIEDMRTYVQEAMLVNARRAVSSHAAYRDGLTDEEMTRVIEAMAGGYWKAAENQLKTLLRTKRTSLVAWSLLAEVLMNQKNFAEVENTVLPEMRFVAGASGSAWIDMTEGCFSLRQEKPDFRKAHDLFIRAFKSNPDIDQAQNMVIQTALWLGDQALTETDCTMILAHGRQHPMANAVLGSLRLNQNRLEEAEKVLNVSIATRPSAPAFNDLGETLRRLGRLPDAERMTRRALLLNPSFYQAWDTLALVLTDQGRFAEASDAHRSALRFCQTDIRLFLNAAKLEQLRGDYTTARALLQQASPLMVHASSAYKEQYDALLKNKPRQ